MYRYFKSRSKLKCRHLNFSELNRFQIASIDNEGSRNPFWIKTCWPGKTKLSSPLAATSLKGHFFQPDQKYEHSKSRDIVLRSSCVTDARRRVKVVCHFISVLLTNATRLLSGDHEGTLIVPWPPYTYAIVLGGPPLKGINRR